MQVPLSFDEMEKVPVCRITAFDWYSLMRKVRAAGAVLITSPDQPEVVVLDTVYYQRLVAAASAISVAAERARALSALQQKFDLHLSSLKAGTALPEALGRPARNGQKVTLGEWS